MRESYIEAMTDRQSERRERYIYTYIYTYVYIYIMTERQTNMHSGEKADKVENS